MISDQPLWLTAVEVARLLSLSRSTVYRLAEAGELRAVRVGSSVRFTRQAVDDFVKAAS